MKKWSNKIIAYIGIITFCIPIVGFIITAYCLIKKDNQNLYKVFLLTVFSVLFWYVFHLMRG